MAKFKPAKLGVMSDIESLALGTRPVILQIAMSSFALDDPSTIVRKFHYYLPIDPQLQLIPPRAVQGSTIAWWMKQGDDARLKIAESAEGDFEDLAALLRAVKRGFEQMVTGLAKHEYELWAKGPQFDVASIESLMKECGIPVPWDYQQVRDLRSLMASAGIGTDDVPQVEGFIPHRADWDCKYQIDCYAKAMHTIGSAK